jgi:hypothetical protein
MQPCAGQVERRLGPRLGQIRGCQRAGRLRGRRRTLATLALFTARTIELGLSKWCPPVTELVVSGGGALNPTLMRAIRLRLRIPVTTTADYGLPVMAKEAACFAWLAARAIKGKTNSCHLATGAKGRRILGKISALFAIDSLAGGFLTTALLSYFFFERFGASELAIGALFFGARVMNAASHLAAARLARRIGLVNTMVFTHVPSSLLLMTVAFAPSFPVAAISDSFNVQFRFTAYNVLNRVNRSTPNGDINNAGDFGIDRNEQRRRQMEFSLKLIF